MTNRATNGTKKCPSHYCRCSVFIFATAFLAAFLVSTLCILHILARTRSPYSLDSSSFLPPRKFMEIKSDSPPLGRFGELMITFLAEDLPFTIFVPSASSFERIFRIMYDKSNMSSSSLTLSSIDSRYDASFLELNDGTFAVISRIFGFSTVPRCILSGMVPENGELALESVSGHRLYLARQPGGALLVNNLVCKTTDIRRGLIVIHVVDGIIMDAAFEQSFRLDSDEFDEEANVR